MVRRAVARFGRIDCAFNNAGIEEEHLKLAESDEALYDRMMAHQRQGRVAVHAPADSRRCSRRAAARSSTPRPSRAWSARRRHAIYAASKHAVVGLTKSAAAEYGKKDIRINSCAPA
jgi:NAD(P)-dependent dehydrogenase (short-subunit alcohol dehydrogenase family)